MCEGAVMTRLKQAWQQALHDLHRIKIAKGKRK
jgi:hypothetical protein